MAIAILVGRNEVEQQTYNWFTQGWKRALLSFNPDLDVRTWPNLGNYADIDYVLVWNHPLGILKKFTQAKAIASLAAGVDHLLVDPDIDHHVPIVRIMDPFMATDIVQYVTAYVLQYVKLVSHWALKQQQKMWFKQPPFTLSNKIIGIMGLGHLGGKAAHVLHQLGLKLVGWSHSPKTITGMTHYAGKAQLHEFLAQANVLICMLPLTKETKNILNRQTFAQLPKASYLINVGRGEHLVEDDLLDALASGQLSGACLDVFRHEPLPFDHPFWSHPHIIVTPHIASVTNPETAAPQVMENYRRLLAGEELLHRVNLRKGY